MAKNEICRCCRYWRQRRLTHRLLLLCQVDIDNAVNVAPDLAEEKEVFTVPPPRGELKGLLGTGLEIPATVLTNFRSP